MVSETGTQIIGILIGFLAYILLYLGKGIQKYAIEGFKDKSETDESRSGKTTKNTAVWIGGTILTASFMIIQWLPLSGIFDNVSPNRIAPLEGFGLIVLLIFSYYVLKEEITKIQVIGSGVIIVGLILINIPTPTTSGVVNYVKEKFDNRDANRITFRNLYGISNNIQRNFWTRYLDSYRTFICNCNSGDHTVGFHKN